MLDFVSEARTAAHRSWERARSVFVRRTYEVDGTSLAHLIEDEVIPRLLVAHRSDQRPASHAMPVIPPGFVQAFTLAAMAEEVSPLLVRLEDLLAGGVTVERICLHVLAPAARQLGEMWEEDACDFVDVTMGLWRLQELVHCLSSRQPAPCSVDEAPDALFGAVAGEQHMLGVRIVEEFFARAGWNTFTTPPVSEDELAGLVAGKAFDLVGLTIATDLHIGTVARAIATLRRASRNPAIVVIVGGKLLVERPEIVVELGADAAPSDAPSALVMAEQLVRARKLQPLAVAH
jgi:methanogenic corrinoid protein MtbC1